MNAKRLSPSHRVSTRIILLFIAMLAIPVGLQTGYANEIPLRQTVLAPAILTTGSNSLQPTQTPASRTGKSASPSTCGQIGFSNTGYTVGTNPASVRLGDFNGDGKLDLVTANYGSSDVSVLLGNGNGTFQNATNYPGKSGASSLAVADIFGDRVDDLIIVSSGSRYASYLQGDGEGAFFPPYDFDMDYSQGAVAVGYLNNDTYADIATAGSNNVSIRLNDGEGDFGSATHVAVSGNPSSIAIGDVNGDSKSDLVTANYNAGNVSVLLGSGNGTFQSPISFMVGSTPLSVAIGDFNGDGRLDLVTANSTSDNVSVLLGNGDGLFQSAVNFGVGDYQVEVATGDFNSDSYLDLITANNSSDNVSVLLGNGDGSFQAALNFSAGDRTNSVVVSDFNGDGKLDIAAANLDAGTVSVLLNTCVSLTNTPTPTSMPVNTNTPTSTPTDTNTPLPTRTPGGPTATSTTTPPPACAIQFADVPVDNTFYPFVRCLACQGIISGYACGGQSEPCNTTNDPYFRPSKPVSRGQLAKIVSNAAGFAEPVSGQTFEDVLPGSAFYPFVERLVSREVMGGYACGGTGEPCGTGNLPYFRPASGATRGQLTKIVSNAAGFTDPAPSTYTFTDVPVGSTFHVYVERLLVNRPGAIGGYDCGGATEPCDPQNRAYFRPANALTRGQTSKIVGNTFFPNCQAQGK